MSTTSEVYIRTQATESELRSEVERVLRVRLPVRGGPWRDYFVELRENDEQSEDVERFDFVVRFHEGATGPDLIEGARFLFEGLKASRPTEMLLMFDQQEPIDTFQAN